MVRNCLIFILYLLALKGMTQSIQSKYLLAKQFYNKEEYQEAKQHFHPLVSDQVFGPYASHYFALSTYHLNEYKQATDMWKQIVIKFPNWGKLNEVFLWLTYASFEQQNHSHALKYLMHLNEKDQKDIFYHFLEEIDSLVLEEMGTLYPNNKELINSLTYLLQIYPNEKISFEYLNDFNKKYNLTTDSLDRPFPIIKKDRYAVAVVLPFMFQTLANPNTVIRNTIVFELYQGMLLAQRDLEKKGILIDLVPYDTKKDLSTTQQIIDNGSLKNADLIVGSLLQDPINLIKDFSKKNKIAMINPLSANHQITENSPYSYLFKPSYKTQGEKAAEYASKVFTHNKNVFIFYEKKKDKYVAKSYKAYLEKKGFSIIRFERITKYRAQKLQEKFSEQYIYKLDSLFSKEEIDSIALIPGRFVRSKYEQDPEGEKVETFYEMKFQIPKDTIGHIFAATSNHLFANNFINIIEVRTDTIGLIGYGNWLDFDLVSYKQLERLNITFIEPHYFKTRSKSYRIVYNKFINFLGKEPSEYHFIGYELTMQIGQILNRYGKNFYLNLKDNYLPGITMDGLQYGKKNDNQMVPILKLENLKLVNQKQ